MNNYLSLAEIQAKLHRRQNSMTILCIALAVFLITGVFSMADMEARHASAHMAKEHGCWHIMLKNMPKEEAENIWNEADVEAAAWYDTINYDARDEYNIGGKAVALMGAEQSFTQLFDMVEEGAFPAGDDQIAVSENLMRERNLSIGDTVALSTPEGSFDYVISGSIRETSSLLAYDSVAAFVSLDSLREIGAANGLAPDPQYYVRLKADLHTKDTINRLRSEHGWTEDNIAENTAALALIGMSSSNYIVGLYIIGAVLVLLVIMAGVLMISGSMSSSVAERTQYFGMLRCVGAGRNQIMRLVRREAVSWCKLAIPIGEACAAVVVWLICGIMRYGIGGEWADMPVFRLSIVGMICGAVIGLITVLIAAHSPAKKAAKVSPIEAVSGNSGGASYARTKAFTGLFKVDTSLGVDHVFSKKSKLILLTGSFALSIILFLTFSVMLDWVGLALDTLKPYTPDLSVYYSGYESRLTHITAEEISCVPGVKNVYGRMYKNMPVSGSDCAETVDLISYEDLQFDWSKKELLSGDIDKVRNGGYLMTVFDKSNSFIVGDTLILAGTETEIAAVLSDSPFSSSDIPTVICSEETFKKLTGTDDYAVIDIQLSKKADDETISGIRSVIGEGVKFSDYRMSTKETNDTYRAFNLVVYGFLAIIALITVFNIMNSISMSVSARNKQYGIMRAVGMDEDQIRRMIAAEALTYAVAGCITGCAIGIPLSAWFYKMAIANYWGVQWHLPFVRLFVILAVVLASAVYAVYRPAKRVLSRTITETINAQ